MVLLEVFKSSINSMGGKRKQRMWFRKQKYLLTVQSVPVNTRQSTQAAAL